MNSITRTHTRMAATAAMATGIAAGVFGIIRLSDTPSGESTTVGIEHVSLAGFTAMVVLLIPVAIYLGRLTGRMLPALIASAGSTALGLLTIVSNVRSEDPSFFPAVAAPSNAMIFIGLALLALALYRGGHLSTLLAVAMPITWILALPGSSVGGPVLAGAYWFAIGWMLQHGELPRPAGSRPEPATS